MDYVVNPGVGVTGFRLGWSLREVEDLIGRPQRWLVRGGSEEWHVWPVILGFHDRTVLTEISVVRSPGVRLLLGGVNLLGASGARAAAAVQEAAPDAVADEHGFGLEAPSLGLYLWRDDNERSRWDSATISAIGWREATPLPRRRAEGQNEPDPPVWDVELGRRVGPVSAGATRLELEAAMGSAPELYADGERIRAAYENVLVEFRADIVHHAEFFGAGRARLVISDVELEAPADELARRLSAAGEDVSIDDRGWVSIGGSVRVFGGSERLTSISVGLPTLE